MRYRLLVVWLSVFWLASIFLGGNAVANSESLAGRKKFEVWVGGENYISVFQGNALKSSGTSRPALAFTTGEWSDPAVMTFDAQGNLWMSFRVTNDNLPGSPIIKITPANISALANREKTKPAVVLRNLDNDSRAFIVPQGLAVDSAGNLWVSDGYRHAIMEFSKGQVKHSGEPTPTVVISSENLGPQYLRFDSRQNLWAVAFNSTLLRFAPGERSESGAPAPGLSGRLSDGLQPIDLAFDGAGNLWVAGGRNQRDVVEDVIEMFPASDLAASGETVLNPSITITSAAFGRNLGSGSCLGGIDFDSGGNLWVSAGTNNASCGGDA